MNDGVAQPSTDGYVYFKIALDRAPEENVRVYYHTRDMSAIASEGDYDAVDDSVLLTPDSYSKVLAVKVYSKSVRIQGTERGENSGNYYYRPNYIEKNRTFRVVLYRAESETGCAVISDTQKFLECSAGYNGVYEICYAGGGDGSNAYYKMYYDNVTAGLSEYWESPEIDGKKTWSSKFEKNGYIKIGNALDKEPVLKQFVEAGIVGLSVTLNGTVQDDNHWEYAGDTYISVICENKEVEPRKDIEALKIVLNTDHMSAGTVDGLGWNGNIKSATFSDAVIKRRDLSFIFPQVSRDDLLYFKVENPDNSDDVWLKLRLTLYPLDMKAPEIVGYYIQDDVRKGEKIGLSLRISEPVQVLNGEKPQIKALINGSMLNEVIFDYVSGNGTDTLYFEADIPDSVNKQITSIRVQEILNIDQIREYANGHWIEEGKYQQGGASLVKPEYNTTVRCNVDLRMPSISVMGNLSTAAERRVEVQLILENISENAKLYYAWTDDDQEPEKYDYTVNNPSAKYTVTGQNMDGKKWLHVKIVSAYGNESTFVRGPYRFDNSPPGVSASLAEESTLTYKKFIINISDGVSGACAGINKVYALISTSPDGSKATEIDVYKGGGEAQKETTYSITAQELGLESNKYAVYYIGFYAVDTIGNQTAAEDIIFTPYRFDTRDFFPSAFEKAQSVAGENLLIDTTSDGARVIDCTETPVLYIEYGDVENPVIESFKRADGSDCAYTTSYVESDGKKFIIITLSDCVAGYAECYLSADDGGTKKISEVFSFYFTKNGTETTAHYAKVQSGALLINKVYQLSEKSVFTYKDSEGVVKTASYGNTALPASFSSAYEAKKYVYYNELLDLYAVKLTAAQATWLNGGTTSNYVKAKNESVTAVEGQIWIRYKSAEWEASSSSNAWVFYYYGPSGSSGFSSIEIDANRLSDNLLNSLNAVSERMVGYGGETYLIGEGKTNALGEPYLAPSQLHIVRESASCSVSGTVFSSEVYYSGDSAIYGSYANIDGEDYAIATNLPLSFGAHTKLYYKSADSAEYREIIKGAGLYLSDAIRVSGVYELKEYDDNGMSVFKIYVDVNAPVLTALIFDLDGSSNSVEFDEQAQGVLYNAKMVMLNGISGLEKDECSYVAVYKYMTSTTGSLLNVYTMDQLASESVFLEDGNYHIEVSDRSGNSYAFVLRIDSSGLVCSVTEEPNKYIKVDCNRTEEQIASYEVTCNGKLLTSTYSTSAKFTQSGFYEILIRDIYGNEFVRSLMFEREIPIISWKYYSDGGYVAYDEDSTTQVKISQASETVYFVTTSVLLQFTLGDGYSFSSNIEWNENPITHTRTMKTISEFVLTVWYTEFSDISVVYICSVDTTPPSITARREVVTYTLGETDEIREQIASGNDGDIIAYSSIGYKKSSVSERFVSDGETVSSRFIRLSVSDTSGVSRIRVYIDGKIYLDETQNFTNVVLSRYGEYVVEASDPFGNLSRFTFTNINSSSFYYYVDGNLQDTEYSCIDYFVGDAYTKKEYGHQSAIIKLYSNAEVAFKITSNATSYITAFAVENGELFLLTYKITVGDNGAKNAVTLKSAPLLSLYDSAFKVGVWYPIATKEQAGADIFACYDKEGKISIKTQASDSSVFTAEGRVYTGTDKEPFYFLAELCSELTNVRLITEDNEDIETNTDGNRIKINKGFTVSSDFIADGKVVSVKVYHSSAGEFSDCKVVFDGEYRPATFSDEGLYLVEIENVYGNTTRYYVILSDQFAVTVKAEFSDGEEAAYSVAYEETVYCNASITITAYAENVSVLVTKDAIVFYGAVIREENGVTAIMIEGDGYYVITLTDGYGNTVVRKAEILSVQPTYTEGLIYGFNEAALKRDEGFTNKRLSVSAELLSSNNFAYAAVRYEGVTTVLYDMLSERKTALDAERLVECIGVGGDGEYSVVFRDRYGNMLVSIVNYRQTPTLELSRTIRSSTEKEICGIDAALTYGLWSNNTLHFESAAEEYIFTVNGRRTECPYTLSFGSGAEEGSFEYSIQYIDEYGFVYEFTATLLRRNIEITLPSSVESKLIDGVPTTRRGFSVIFDDNAVCRYSVNGGEEVVYVKDSTIYADGVYRFTATDAAGNVSSFTVKKDSAVLFALTETATGNEIVNGGIACTDRVAFSAKGDDAFIEKVFLDGKYLADYNDNKFTQSGKWELILADGAGNRAYFCFYVLTHSVNKFEYTAPYLYRISEVWYDSGDGTRISYIEFLKGDGTICEFTENGTYSLVMTSDESGKTINFNVNVNNVAPDVSLVGCEENQTTLNNVTVTGYKVGDTIEVYRNGQLVRTVKVLTSSTDAPVISEGGDYKIVVRNEAGVETSLSFTRKHIPNVAGSVLIFISIFACVVLISVGMFYRNHSKSDD